MASSSSEEIWIVVPAYNEAEVIASVINSLEPYKFNVVVVDDCSTDDTSAQLKGSNCITLRHAVNLGQGAALQTGITYALKNGAKYLVTFDADGQHQHEDIPALLAPLMSGNFDVALGTRFSGKGEAQNIPNSRRVLLKIATLLTRLTTRLDLSDTHNGFKAFTADAAQKLNITQNRMSHASQILSRIRQHRMRYTEVPVRILYTEYSISKGQKMSNAVNILWEAFMESIGA